MKLRIFLVLFTGCWLASPGQAQEKEKNASLTDTLYLQPVSIIALHPRVYEAEKHELDYVDQMTQDGGALLDRLPAFGTIRKSGAYGLDPVFRGFKYEQLNVVLNGAQSALAACPNRMDPPTSQLTPNMIQRVEVLKGPHALRYGCAFGATINFVPVEPRFSEEKQVYGRLSGGFESNGNILRSEGMLGLAGKRIDLGFFGSWSRGSDYLDGNGGAVASMFMKGSGGVQLGLKLAERQVLKLSATRNLARNVDFPALPMDLRSDDTWMLNASHEITFRKQNLRSWNTALYGSLVEHRMDNFTKIIEPRKVDAETLATTGVWGGRMEGKWTFSSARRLYAGADLRMENAAGFRSREFLMGPNTGNIVEDNVWQEGQVLRTGIFGEYHLKAAGIHWVVSGRMELNKASSGDPDPGFISIYTETGNTQINPGISLGGKLPLGKHFSTGLWLGRASRSGSITERYINYFPVGLDPYEMIGNPQINAEVNNQADLQLEWKAEGSVIKLDLFASLIQDYISSTVDTTLTSRMPTSPGVRRFENLDLALLSGFELAYNQRLVAGLQQQLSLNYTCGQDLVRKEALPEIAPLDFRYRISGSYLDQRLLPWISFRHVLEQKRISTEFGESSTPAFTLMDLGLSFRATPFLKISVRINNLLDVAIYEHLSRSVRSPGAPPIYTPGRSFLLSFSLDFR